jgi:hypothetical protein
MSTSTDTGKAETVAKSAETNKPVEGTPLAGKIAIVTGGGRAPGLAYTGAGLDAPQKGRGPPRPSPGGGRQRIYLRPFALNREG